LPHKPVLLDEVLALLAPRPGEVVLDGTLGSGGHAREILNLIGESGRLIGLDRDPRSLERCQKIFGEDRRVSLHFENFVCAGKVLDDLNVPCVDAVILDVGFSSDQVEEAGRGFSFDREGPLDMRMDPRETQTAGDLINDLSQEELERIFLEYGGERFSRRFARAICEARKREAIRTTLQLAGILNAALPGAPRYATAERPGWARRHPATRVFQALRIAVNREIENLEQGLKAIFPRLRVGGRFGVISFHSLEDRIVKRIFRQWRDEAVVRWVTRKPVAPGRPEQIENPRSRSAKLRVVEKIV